MSGFKLTEEQWLSLCNSIDGTVMVEGFVFSALLAQKIYMAIHKIPEERLGGMVACSKKTIDEHIRFINEHHVENIIVCRRDIGFLEKCPGVKSVIVIPPHAVEQDYDFSPLYRMENLIAADCGVEYDAGEKTTVDFTKMKGIRQICTYVENFKGATGFQQIPDLESLSLGGYKCKHLEECFCSDRLKFLELIEVSLKDLEGIERAKDIRRIELVDMKVLEDINALERVAGSLRELRIFHCSRIRDFSVLGKLVNLQHLELRGRNKLPDLKFLENMKDLRSFVFDMDVVDGDLSPCMQVPYVFSHKNRRHYNIKNKDLPKEDTYWEWGLRFVPSPERLV